MRRDVNMDSKNSDNNQKKTSENTYETKVSQDQRATPVMPLPNPGEGGAVYPGDMGNNSPDMGATPVIPSLNPGEGGAVYPGPTWPQNNNSGNNNITLPNIIGTIISTYPRPNEPCRFCQPNISRAGYVRFLNAAAGYNPFVVFINENVFSNALNFSEITSYESVGANTQIITIMGENGYIYVQKRVELDSNEYVTIAIINTESGLDIEVIEDTGCDRRANSACVRAANLSHNSGTLNVVIGNQYITFPNLKFKDVSSFERIMPGVYVYTVTKNTVARFAPTMLLTAAVGIQRNRNYTIYLLNWNRDSTDTIKALIVEDM